MRQVVDMTPEVEAALAGGRAVVALESTIIAHGLPRPENLNVAREIEDLVRQGGAVPATVAVLDGRICVGCSSDQLERLATDPGIGKASLRDLPLLLARRHSGATTVAATTAIAAAAGIPVFVTGGIGGVHRGAERSWDVSADLTVLGREPVAVVCAGAKSILDIGATLEMLETLGVTVLGYQTDRFPGFYIRKTEFPVDARVESAADAAAVVWARRQAGIPGGVLLVNPLPEAAALDGPQLEAAIGESLAEAARIGKIGKTLTPFLLARLREATAGRSLQANLALIRSNAELGARLAVALADLAGGPAGQGSR